MDEKQEWVIYCDGLFMLIPDTTGARKAWGMLALALQIPTKELAEKVLESCQIVGKTESYKIMRLNEAKIMEIMES